MADITRRAFFGTTAAGAAAWAPGAAADNDRAGTAEPERLNPPIALDDLPTPALIVDMDQCDANLRTMAGYLTARGVGLRPHTKTHKCPHLARRQMALGAVGICCAKVSEAEVMAAAGLGQILITSPVVTKDKIDRVITLAARCPGLAIVVDHAENADDLDASAGAANLRLTVLIDLDPHMGRTGTAMGTTALGLARHIAQRKHLRLGGVQCYAGNLMHVKDYTGRRARSHAVLAEARDTKALIEQDGIELAVFTGGGTGTYDIDAEFGGLTDIQCGSYLVMDVQYGIVGAPEGQLFDAFPPAMFVWTTAISQPAPGRITVDAGLKAVYRDSPYTAVRGIDGVTYGYGGDEHGILDLKNPSTPIKLGDKRALIPAHCDPTINLYDVFYAYRNGVVEERWPIAARGKSQ